MANSKSINSTTQTSKKTSRVWSDAYKTWNYTKERIPYDKMYLLHLCWNDPKAMADLIMAHSWQSLKWVHLFEKEKLRIIQNFLIDRKKHYTLEGRLGKEQTEQLKLEL